MYMYGTNGMHMSADAQTAPAHQSAPMTATCTNYMGTALRAVSFLLAIPADLAALAVRIPK